MAFLVYHVSDYNEGKNLPIAAAASKNDAMSLGARTVLELGWLDGGLSIVENKLIGDADIDALNQAVSGYLNREQIAT